MAACQFLEGVLNAAELTAIRDGLSNASFTSGLSTNPNAATIKHNLQAQPDDAARRLGLQVQQALFRHPQFGPATLPKRSSEPFFARYEAGMFYRDHIDEPLLRGQVTLRTDLSCTVFISEPDTYKGGELLIGREPDRTCVKLAAGDAVIYPSDSVHQITEVTGGIRIVALCWLESLVREHERRQILYQLDMALADVMGNAKASDDSALALAQARSNLIRMWADT
ncbi:MAG: Fe2+-dependent dioxygenase [Pseudomonadales bacterium]